MKALILAGGPGAGLRPLTLNTPKPIIPIANRPMVLYQLDLLKRAGIHEILLSLSYQPRQIEDLLKDGADFGMVVRYRSEGAALGPIGALSKAIEWVDGPVVIVGADVLTTTDLAAAIARHRERNAIATFVLAEDEIGRWGISTDETGRVLGDPAHPDRITNPGIFILEPGILDYLGSTPPDQIETDFIGVLAGKGVPVFVDRASEYWMHIDSPDRYLEAHRDILNGRLSLESFPLAAPFSGRSPTAASALIDPGAAIHQTAEIVSSVIGPNCSVGAGARVVDSVLWSGNSVGDHAEIAGSILGRGCFVGSSVVLPAGTVLGGKSSITEFSRFAPA